MISGRAALHTVAPEAVSTISSLSLLRRFSVWMAAISSEKGAMIAIRLGSASVVILTSIHTSWPCEVTTLSWRRASAIHTMADSDKRMISSAPPACRKTYLSKIVIGYPKRQNLQRGVTSPVRAP